MAYILLNNQVFSIDDGYLEETDNVLYTLHSLEGDVVGELLSDTIKQLGFRLPNCYHELFQKRIYAKALEEYLSIDIVPVLKLVVNNERYINYLIKPMVLDEDIAGREGGQYFAFKMINDELVLIGGQTGTQFLLNYKHNIPACRDKTLIVLKDKYFYEAIDKLKEMYELQDVCVATYFYSTFKDPITDVPECGEGQSKRKNHCGWCIELGLDGKHGPLIGDGTIYIDGSKTTHTPWGRYECLNPDEKKKCC